MDDYNDNISEYKTFEDTVSKNPEDIYIKEQDVDQDGNKLKIKKEILRKHGLHNLIDNDSELVQDMLMLFVRNYNKKKDRHKRKRIVIEDCYLKKQVPLHELNSKALNKDPNIDSNTASNTTLNTTLNTTSNTTSNTTLNKDPNANSNTNKDQIKVLNKDQIKVLNKDLIKVPIKDPGSYQYFSNIVQTAAGYNSFFDYFDENLSINNAISCDVTCNENTSSYIFEKNPQFFNKEKEINPFNKEDLNVYDLEKNKHKKQKNIGRISVIAFSAMFLMGSTWLNKYFS